MFLMKVGNHTLSLLLICSVVQGMRFLQLKNPWSHLRWKGRYSERDDKNWTPELLKYLNFDPKTAQKFDNGDSKKQFDGEADLFHIEESH